MCQKFLVRHEPQVIDLPHTDKKFEHILRLGIPQDRNASQQVRNHFAPQFRLQIFTRALDVGTNIVTFTRPLNIQAPALKAIPQNQFKNFLKGGLGAGIGA
jgi:hypothetical protein